VATQCALAQIIGSPGGVVPEDQQTAVRGVEGRGRMAGDFAVATISVLSHRRNGLIPTPHGWVIDLLEMHETPDAYQNLPHRHFCWFQFAIPAGRAAHPRR
jgi:hypothetical protein